jgi:hypothetical protein
VAVDLLKTGRSGDLRWSWGIEAMPGVCEKERLSVERKTDLEIHSKLVGNTC